MTHNTSFTLKLNYEYYWLFRCNSFLKINRTKWKVRALWITIVASYPLKMWSITLWLRNQNTKLNQQYNLVNTQETLECNSWLFTVNTDDTDISIHYHTFYFILFYFPETNCGPGHLILGICIKQQSVSRQVWWRSHWSSRRD